MKPSSVASCLRMPAIRRSSGEFAPSAMNEIRLTPTSTESGSTRSRSSRFSFGGFGLAPAAVRQQRFAGAFFIRQPTVPRPAPSSRNGIFGSPGNSASATSTPLASSSGCDAPKICFWNSTPRRFSELARVTIMPPEMEIISAGITVTRPSPIVSTV